MQSDFEKNAQGQEYAKYAKTQPPYVPHIDKARF